MGREIVDHLEEVNKYRSENTQRSNKIFNVEICQHLNQRYNHNPPKQSMKTNAELIIQNIFNLI